MAPQAHDSSRERASLATLRLLYLNVTLRRIVECLPPNRKPITRITFAALQKLADALF
jgi:hypothetical protein